MITGNAAMPRHVTELTTSTACLRKAFGARQIAVVCPKAPLRSVPTSPRMWLLLLSERLLVVLTSDLALSLLLLPGAIMLPPHLLPLLPKQPALPRHNCAPSAAPAGATLSCLKIRCCQTPTRCLRGAPRCRRVGESDNVYTVPQMSRTFLSRALT